MNMLALLRRVGPRKGASIVISTVILAGTTLSITVAALMFSDNVLKIQLDVSEFEQAKNVLLTLADMVEDVSANPLSAHYVRFNVRTSKPCFLAESSTISVTVVGLSEPVISGSIGVIEIGGGPLVGTVETRSLLGEDCLIVNDVSEPLARVYEEQSSGAWVRLDYSRARVTNLGCFYFYDVGDGMSGYLNAVRIAFANMTIGTTMGSGPLNIVVRSVRTTLRTVILSSNEVTVRVTVDGIRTETVTVEGLSSVETAEGPQPVIGTIVQVLTSEVVVSSD